MLKIWGKKAAKRFMRGESDELSVAPKYLAAPGDGTFDRVAGQLPRMRKRGDTIMSGIVADEQPKRKRKKGTKAAKATAAAQGVAWASLSKLEKQNRRLLARAEKGNERAARKLAKRLGVTPLAPATVTPGAPDPVLLKSVLRGPTDDVSAAASALAAIKAALGRPRIGDGWR
jgi:hypothetical protein